MIPEENRAPIQAQINALRLQEAEALTAIQAARVALGLGTGGAAEASVWVAVAEIYSYNEPQMQF
jgi:hypothetical protein